MKNLLALTLPSQPPISESDPDIFPGWKLGTGPSGDPLTLADIINLLLPLIFVVAGLILFLMLVFGGLTIFMSAGNPESMKKGTQQITNALIGLLIIFAAYWIVQLVEYSLGLNLLGV